MNEGIIGAL